MVYDILHCVGCLCCRCYIDELCPAGYDCNASSTESGRDSYGGRFRPTRMLLQRDGEWNVCKNGDTVPRLAGKSLVVMLVRCFMPFTCALEKTWTEE
jgi:hypothetical protein